MGIEYEGTRFEWDEEKAEANILNHSGVTFFEAVTVFGDPLSVICDDDEHSIGERRFLTIGRSSQDRILIVSYTERGDVIRILGAREAEPKEIRAYEEEDG
ncbi:MAG TPA: BrnT family toxin [Candidatus Binatia bacterium]